MFLKSVLFFHILCGISTLLTGLLAVTTKKGSPAHIYSGKIFYFGMTGVCLTAIIMAVIKENSFLLLIGIFSFYQAYMGRRAIKNKSLRPSVPDWFVLVTATLNSLFMIFSMNPILVFFGAINAFAVTGNWTRNFTLMRNGVLDENSWLKVHISMMMGAYIATITAFLVVNQPSLKFLNLPPALLWFLPTIILVPLLIYWTKKHSLQLKN